VVSTTTSSWKSFSWYFDSDSPFRLFGRTGSRVGMAEALFLVTIDGTDCQIQEPVPYNSIWWSHKFNGPALKYELAVCIKTGDIIWLGGPWPAAVHDQEVFDEALSDMLMPGEMVEVDSGYNRQKKIATSGMGRSHRIRKVKSQARGWQENVNGQAKCSTS
jgi:hypothetical protein